MPTSLSEVIAAWMDWDEQAIPSCLGNFENYLIGVVAIIEAWTSGSHILSDELSSQVTMMFNHEDPYGQDILDPHYFGTIRFRRLYPQVWNPSKP